MSRTMSTLRKILLELEEKRAEEHAGSVVRNDFAKGLTFAMNVVRYEIHRERDVRRSSEEQQNEQE